MARTLKTTGIATDLTFLVAYDDDNTTLKEWVSSDVNSNKTLTSGTTTGTTTWKSTTLGYWQPDDTHYLTFASTHRPLITANITVVFLMIDGPASVAGTQGLMDTTGQNNIVRNGNASDVLALIGTQNATATAITTQRSYSVGFQGRSDTGDNLCWYGLESGSAAVDATNDNGGQFPVINDEILGLGFVTVRGSYAAKYVLCAMFDRLLTTGEYQSIHDDPIGTLFEAAAAQSTNRNGIALSAISAINGITKSGISAINGLTI